MMVTYRCPNGHEFDGHWHKVQERQKQFPDSKLSDFMIVRLCPECGARSNGKNIEETLDPFDFTSEGDNNDN